MMAFYALLLTFDKARRTEATRLLAKIVSGKFQRSHITPQTLYAEAWAHYLLAFLIGRHDVLELWLKAHALQTDNRFCSKYLPLPKKPLLA